MHQLTNISNCNGNVHCKLPLDIVWKLLMRHIHIFLSDTQCSDQEVGSSLKILHWNTSTVLTTDVDTLEVSHKISQVSLIIFVIHITIGTMMNTGSLKTGLSGYL